MRPIPNFVRCPRWPALLALAAISLAATGCGGPRMHRYTDRTFTPLASAQQVEIYVGRIEPPYERIALIETNAYTYEDREAKLRQMAELREKARRLGANAVQEVRILPKHIKGYTIDERVPFPSWKQGEYSLYLMRGVAIRLPEPGAPGVAAAPTRPKPAVADDLRPEGGWQIERFAPPARMDATTQPATAPAATF